MAKCFDQKSITQEVPTTENKRLSNTRKKSKSSTCKSSWFDNGIPYLPTSAKENTNVEIGFTRAVQIWEQIHGYSDMMDIPGEKTNFGLNVI